MHNNIVRANKLQLVKRIMHHTSSYAPCTWKLENSSTIEMPKQWLLQMICRFRYIGRISSNQITPSKSIVNIKNKIDLEHLNLAAKFKFHRLNDRSGEKFWLWDKQNIGTFQRGSKLSVPYFLLNRSMQIILCIMQNWIITPFLDFEWY